MRPWLSRNKNSHMTDTSRSQRTRQKQWRRSLKWYRSLIDWSWRTCKKRESFLKKSLSKRQRRLEWRTMRLQTWLTEALARNKLKRQNLRRQRTRKSGMMMSSKRLKRSTRRKKRQLLWSKVSGEVVKPGSEYRKWKRKRMELQRRRKSRSPKTPKRKTAGRLNLETMRRKSQLKRKPQGSLISHLSSSHSLIQKELLKSKKL